MASHTTRVIAVCLKCSFWMISARMPSKTDFPNHNPKSVSLVSLTIVHQLKHHCDTPWNKEISSMTKPRSTPLDALARAKHKNPSVKYRTTSKLGFHRDHRRRCFSSWRFAQQPLLYFSFDCYRIRTRHETKKETAYENV
jgi:hypothetical protein